MESLEFESERHYYLIFPVNQLESVATILLVQMSTDFFMNLVPFMHRFYSNLEYSNFETLPLFYLISNSRC